MREVVRIFLGVCVIAEGLATLVKLFFLYRAGVAELADLKRRLGPADKGKPLDEKSPICNRDP
ncbi:hypothetical protein OG601_47325 [Streptomyces sp. NBC_01239]|uniref:hypothetical protein n=1 Tax=Streptomyces sp. NBC_01239 TaxID=2903792 RepID=UPI00224C948B|nr:hypothetical protein [Streptomyces sp. NBC_01239]MCX4816739.1 hypothetical protein [Streptomyces sp. NBC_01239]MCX4818187.1 hypothetical protein [Streptomyces sp. NBC_01239]